MTYDLRRLRLNGLIHRLPHTNRYPTGTPRHAIAITRHVDEYASRAPTPRRAKLDTHVHKLTINDG